MPELSIDPLTFKSLPWFAPAIARAAGVVRVLVYGCAAHAAGHHGAENVCAR